MRCRISDGRCRIQGRGVGCRYGGREASGPQPRGARLRGRARPLALARRAAWPPPRPRRADPAPTRIVYAPGKIVPIPASIPHEEGDMVDRRILPDLRWIAAALPDLRHRRLLGPAARRRTRRLQPLPRPRLRPLQRPRRRHRPGRTRARNCDSQLGRRSPRLALWAEPVQNQPRPALPLGRLRRRRRPRLRQPPAPLLEPRRRRPVPARRMGRSLPRRRLDRPARKAPPQAPPSRAAPKAPPGPAARPAASPRSRPAASRPAARRLTAGRRSESPERLA